MNILWIADHPFKNTFSACETRVLAPLLSLEEMKRVYYLAVGYGGKSFRFREIPILPFCPELEKDPDLLSTYIAQIKPDIVITSLLYSQFHEGFESLNKKRDFIWVHREMPDESEPPVELRPDLLLRGVDKTGSDTILPYQGNDSNSPSKKSSNLSSLLEKLFRQKGQPLPLTMGNESIVMRMHLFANYSLSHTMYELTNALALLKVPVSIQPENMKFARTYIKKEEEYFRKSEPDKYSRIIKCLNRKYDLRNSYVIHHTVMSNNYNRYFTSGSFLYGDGKEVLYTTGNHLINRETAKRINENYYAVLGCSRYLLQSYRQSGIPSEKICVLSHGVDPEIFHPQASKAKLPQSKNFRFLQTSFPWIHEKGFDLTIKAFSQAFTSNDDVSLILRIPRLNKDDRSKALLELVNAACQKPLCPEIHLLEEDVFPHERGGYYTACDAYVHPLRAEGFAMTLLEAMACGLPVIATAWSGPADYLNDWNSFPIAHGRPQPLYDKNREIQAYHVEPNLDHLIELMQYVFNNRDEAKEVGQVASRDVANQWTWKHAAQKLVKFLHINNL